MRESDIVARIGGGSDAVKLVRLVDYYDWSASQELLAINLVQ